MITAVVLAAGASRRMGANKLLLPLAGEPVVRRTVREVCTAGFDDVLVVLGREAEAVRAALDALPCRFAINQHYETGMGSSFRVAVAHLDASEAALFALADQPFVTPAEYRALLDAFDRFAPAIVGARFAGVPAPPHLFARELFPELRNLEHGAKPVLVRHADRAVVLDFPGAHVLDIDTPDDYTRAQQLAASATPAREAPRVDIEESTAGRGTIEPVGTSTAAFVDGFVRGPLNQAVLVQSVADFDQAFGGLDGRSEASYGVRLFFENGGRQAWIVRVPFDESDDVGGNLAPGQRGCVSAAALIGRAEEGSGLHALVGVERVNIVCVPAASALAEADAEKVYAAAEAVCRTCGAFLIVDPPPSRTEPFAFGLRNRDAAAYFPMLVVDDPLQPGATRTIAPSGAVAGVYATTDAARGVWTAPAGLRAPLRGVRLARALTSYEIERATKAGVNALTAFLDRGPLVWGARTLASTDTNAPEWKYVPVRRLALFLEASVSRGTAWAVVEPNNEGLRREVRRTVSVFLDSLWRQGAFAGRAGREAYFVKCDSENNLPGDPDLTIDIGFAPLRPAEFVDLRVRHHFGDPP